MPPTNGMDNHQPWLNFAFCEMWGAQSPLCPQFSPNQTVWLLEIPQGQLSCSAS